MEAEGQTGRNQLDEMPEHQIFELLKLYAHDGRVRDRRYDCINAHQCAGNLRIFYGGICHLFKCGKGEDDPCESGDD